MFTNTAQPTENAYCAYATARRYAAQNRNYNNCLECKKARQKCNGSDGIACDRCLKFGKDCSLSPAMNAGDSRRRMASGLDRPPLQRNSRADDERRFGKIIYVIPCDDGRHVEIIHVRTGNNGVDQVYLTRCDTTYIPVGPMEYVCPWSEYVVRLEESISAVGLQAMSDV